MKNNRTSRLLLVVSLILSGCGEEGFRHPLLHHEPDEFPASESITAGQFPTVEGMIWTYYNRFSDTGFSLWTGGRQELGGYNCGVFHSNSQNIPNQFGDAIYNVPRMETYFHLSSDAYTEIGTGLKITGGGIITNQFFPKRRLFDFPLTEDKQWTVCQYVDSGVPTEYRMTVEEYPVPVATPAGIFTGCAHLREDVYENGSLSWVQMDYWIAPDIGVVKFVFLQLTELTYELETFSIE